MSARVEAQKRYQIVPARPEDADELAVLVNSAYRGDSSRKGWTTEADLLDGQRTNANGLREEIERGDREGTRVILCLREVAGESDTTSLILACVSLERCASAGAGAGAASGAEPGNLGVTCYLGMLTVMPPLQAGGIGRILLEGAENFARERWGARRMILGVIQLREELIAWYERRGYVRTGETKPFPYGNEAFGLPRRTDLHFAMFEKPL